MEHNQTATRADPVRDARERPARVRPGGGRRPWIKRAVLPGAVVLAALLIAGLGWFEPWKLWIDKTVDEAAPGPGAVVIAQGTFVSHEHQSSGSVSVLRLTDGTLVLRIDQLDTSNGPLLRVWLSDAPVLTDKAGWKVFDQGKHVDLGRLKGNKGSQNYVIPQDVDVAGYSSVTIWCDRFNVSFAAASLR